jgi:hypothetical protein
VQFTTRIDAFCSEEASHRLFRGEILTICAWYAACSASYIAMATKGTNNYSDVDGNWSWPEKTWFRERLNAVKARDHEQRRKPIFAAQKPVLSTTPTGSEEDPLKVD